MEFQGIPRPLVIIYLATALSLLAVNIMITAFKTSPGMNANIPNWKILLILKLLLSIIFKI